MFKLEEMNKWTLRPTIIFMSQDDWDDICQIEYYYKCY